MARNVTKFKFFYNTPLTDYQNTIHFSSNAERDKYFLNENHFVSRDFSDIPFNFIRDRSVVTIGRSQLTWGQAQWLNYCTFISDFERTRYYAFVNQIEYINDNAIKLYLVIDVLMTYTQGNKLTTVGNAFVERQHFPRSQYNRLLP